MAENLPSLSIPEPGNSLNGSGAGIGAGPGIGAPRTVKRPRPVKSCFECRRRKLKCDRLLPCSQCQKGQRSCHYAADADAANGSDGSEDDVERPVKRSGSSSMPDATGRGRDRMQQVSAAIFDDHVARLERLEKMVLTASSPTTETSSSRNQLPPVPLVSSARTIRGITVKGDMRTRFFGQSSTRILLNLFGEARQFMVNQHQTPDFRDASMAMHQIHQKLQEQHRKALMPMSVYTDSILPIKKRMADILPPKPVCDYLVEAYLTGSESLYRILHVHNFREQYNRYWESQEQSTHFLPQLLATLCIGYRFLGPGKGLKQHDKDGIHIPTACTLVRSWLDGLKGKQLVEFGTLQTHVLVMMAVRMINPRNHESFLMLGMIVRMAMTMGLHRDPSEFSSKLSPYWAEQRRRVWYTIMELDLQVALLCNMPGSVRPEDYNCRPPLNLDDSDLLPHLTELPPGQPLDVPTNTRIQAFAARSLPARARVVEVLSRIDSLTDYQAVFDCGHALERIFDELTYVLPYPHYPAQNNLKATREWVTTTLLDQHARRALLALYRPFALSIPGAPQEILVAYLRSSVVMLTYLDNLDAECPSSARMHHMHTMVMRHDITQAAFSVCYYIQHAKSFPSYPSPVSAPSLPDTKAEAIGEAVNRASESSVLFTVPRLIHTVGHALARLIARVGELESEVRDLMALSVVFSFCQGGTTEQKQQRLHQHLQAILESGVQALRAIPEANVSLPFSAMSSASAALNNPAMQSSQSGFAQPYFATQDMPTMLPDDFMNWDMDLWSWPEISME